MNFRTLLGVFGKQRAWSRIRGCWRTYLLTRSGIAISKYPRTALLLSLTGVYNASYTPHNLPVECTVDDAYLQGLTKELGELERLKNATLICKHCKQRLLIDKPVDDKVYCKCAKNVALVDESTGWQPFLESKDIIIWRREEEPGSGLHEYKVYGRYEEVTAEDFLSMHTDLVYWRSWDDTALTVKRLPQPSKSLQNDNQEIIYWETLWPRFFANRDYVYVRRHAYMDVDYKCIPNNIGNSHHIQERSDVSHSASSVQSEDKCSNSNLQSKSKHNDDDYGHKMEQHTRNSPENVRNALEIGNFMNSHLLHDKIYIKNNVKKIIVLTSQSCEHPDAPLTSKAHRVKRYRSDLVIKPLTDLDKPGIEFSLTYFDDPGTSIPNALQSWVAGHACPEFLHKMRLAAGNYKKSSRAAHNFKHQDKARLSTQGVPAGQLSQVNQELILSSVKDASNTEVNSQCQDNNMVTHEIELDKQLLYKQKTQRDTEELLSLLSGNTNPVNNTSQVMQANSEVEWSGAGTVHKQKQGAAGELKRDGGKEAHEQQDVGQDKHRESHQQSMSYWHIWPLYYFA